MSTSRIESITWTAGSTPRSVYLEDAGDGVPVVLLHSSGMSGDQWKRTAEALRRRGLRTILPHLLGSGRSTPWPEGEAFAYTLDVDLVCEIVARIGEPVHLVGHSYGGLLALLAALRTHTTGRVLSIAAYDPVAFGVLERGRDVDAFADLDRLAFGWGASSADHDAWLRGFVDYWGGEGAWSHLREAPRAEMTRVGWIVHEGARTLVSDRTPASAYGALSIPTLFVTGQHTPGAARGVVARLGATIPGARVELVEGAGHMGPLTHGGRFNELLEAHLG